MMSRHHSDVATKVDVATRDGGCDKRRALKNDSCEKMKLMQLKVMSRQRTDVATPRATS